jgi:hypothetical protein
MEDLPSRSTTGLWIACSGTKKTGAAHAANAIAMAARDEKRINIGLSRTEDSRG